MKPPNINDIVASMIVGIMVIFMLAGVIYFITVQLPEDVREYENVRDYYETYGTPVFVGETFQVGQSRILLVEQELIDSMSIVVGGIFATFVIDNGESLETVRLPVGHWTTQRITIEDKTVELTHFDYVLYVIVKD